jgi:hypothetical protein
MGSAESDEQRWTNDWNAWADQRLGATASTGRGHADGMAARGRQRPAQPTGDRRPRKRSPRYAPRWARWGYERREDDTLARKLQRFAAREGWHLASRYASMALIAAVRAATDRRRAAQSQRRADLVRGLRGVDRDAAAMAAARISIAANRRTGRRTS